MITKAMVFAAGKGTRLRPLTDHMPKALVEVGGEPMLKRVILKLKEVGINEMVVNVHHFAVQVKDYIASNNQFGINIHISDESDRLLDTGGGILKASSWFEADSEPFVVHNVDILTDFDLTFMINDHKSHRRDITLLCDNRKTSRYLLFDKNMRMHGWTNVNSGQVRPAQLDPKAYEHLAFGGVHIIQPSVLKDIRDYCKKRAEESHVQQSDYPFSITDFFIEYCKKINIGGFRPAVPYIWHDIGKPESLEQANSHFVAPS